MVLVPIGSVWVFAVEADGVIVAAAGKNLEKEGKG
jgi:hypothetical protein